MASRVVAAGATLALQLGASWDGPLSVVFSSSLALFSRRQLPLGGISSNPILRPRIPRTERIISLRIVRHGTAASSSPNSKILKGEELFRIRIGVYRVVCEIEAERLVVFIVRVKHRKDAC
jgi:hypothetical protein